jgi:DNA modification methylase
LLADRNGVVIAGNKTLEQAIALGLPIKVVQTDGKSLVVVQRSDLDLDKHTSARELAIRDNRIAELDLEWDPNVLEELRAAGLELDSLWTAEEWGRLGVEATADSTEDQVLEPGPTTVQRGEMFMLGRHRLLCGDATDGNDVRRLLGDQVPILMPTDPPYGVKYSARWRHTVYPKQRSAVGAVQNDDRASWPQAFAHFPGDVIYAWHAGVKSAEAASAIEDAGFEIRSQIIWVKSHFVLSRGAYHWNHEPAFYAVRRGASAHWLGDRSQTTVWNVPNLNPFGGKPSAEDGPTGHSTQKPVRLFEIPILNHTTSGQAIYDPFVGSGTSVVAAEKTGRSALVMDIDPQYVQVTLDRWETYAGKKAKRIGHPRGRRR